MLVAYLAASLCLAPGCTKNYTDAPGTAKAETKSKAVNAAEDEFFQIAVLPDTQYYTGQNHGGTVTMFQQQVDWIKANRETSKIAYVIHLGNIVDHGEDVPAEWTRAKNVLYQLETPVTGLPNGIPYGLAVGNHDLTPNGFPGEGYGRG